MWTAINKELIELVDLMDDSRARYLAESIAQSDGIPKYFVHLLGIVRASKPWTFQLIRCGLAIGNLVYMHYKWRSAACGRRCCARAWSRRSARRAIRRFRAGIRSSATYRLVLLEIDPVASALWRGDGHDGNAGAKPTWANYRTGTHYGDGPLFWLAAVWRRIASASACTIQATAERAVSSPAALECDDQ